MAFYVFVWSAAAVAIAIAVLMHWPKLENPDGPTRSSTQRHLD